MRVRVKQCVGAVAILAIALHGALLSLAPLAMAASADPFSVICHAAASAAPEAPTPAGPDHVDACDHCNLCSATAIPPVSANVARVTLEPRPVAGLAMVAPALRNAILDEPRPRGPPPST